MKIKYMAILLILLCFLIGAASAADDGTIDSLDAAQDDAVSIDAVEEADEVASTEPTSTQTDEKLEQSNDDEKLEVTRTVEVNNFNELTDAINSAANDAVNDTYVINLNPGTYTVSAATKFNAGTVAPNIIINGNGQTLAGSKRVTFSTGGSITINGLTISHSITSNTKLTLKNVVLGNTFTNNMDLTVIDSTINKAITNKLNLDIKNSTINADISNTGTVTIDELSKVGSSFKKITGAGEIYTTNTEVINRLRDNYIFVGEHSLVNTAIATAVINHGRLTIENSTISQLITNYGEITIKNSNTTNTFANNGNMTLIKVQLTSSGASTNYGNLTFTDSYIYGPITNNGNITINDDTTFGEKFKLTNNEGSNLFTNNDDIKYYLNTYYENYIFENVNNFNLNNRKNYGTLYFINCNVTCDHSQFINGFKNYGNITIINSTWDVLCGNYGNITVENSTLSYKLSMNSPSSTLIIKDNVTFTPDLTINNNQGNIICNNPEIFKYYTLVEGNHVIRDLEISGQKTYSGNITLINCTILQNGYQAAIINNGNLIVINSTIIGIIQNNANLTLINSSMESTSQIYNYGILTVNKTILTKIGNYGILVIPIGEDKEVEEVYGPNLSIGNFNDKGMGLIETNDMSKIFPYTFRFYQEATVALGTFDKQIENFGILTIENSTLTGSIYNEGTLILKNTTVIGVDNAGILELRNVTISGTLFNRGTKVYGGASANPTLIISDDTQFDEGFIFRYNAGTVITNNTEKFAEYMSTYNGDVVLTNKTIINDKLNYGNLTLNNCIINKEITNYGTLTLNNCTINSNILNKGNIIIDDDTIFGNDIEISGSGELVINDISKALPYITTINGNYVISDKTLTKPYTFYGAITLNNCTITSSDNVNYATLILNKCTVDVGADNTFLTNLQTVHVSRDTTINGKINDITGGVTYENLPQNVPKTYIITQESIKYFIDDTGLNTIINPGDILDIRGRIQLNNSLRINKPVNIISSTKDGWIDLNTTAGDYFGSYQGNSLIIYSDGAYTNITGVTFHNTQLWLAATHHVTLDNISVIVENQRIGSGVGVTSIRQGSRYITVKNSYFHTTENEGSSTLVLAYANYCTIENNTIEGDGFVGNLLYITTYNVNIPDGAVFNAHNKLINNRLRGPETPTSTCYGICISGFDNLVDNNTINSKGSGIMFQWGSGVNGIEQEECVYGSGENIVSNNKLYGGCGINAGDLIFNNYMEGSLAVPANSIAYNNTANQLNVGPKSKVINNTINGKVTFNSATKDATIENNTIKGDIEIPSTVTNVTLIGNNIIGSVTLDGSFNNLTNNRIITSNDYAVSSNKLGKNNTLEGNYLVANGKVGNDAVSLRDESNVIASAGVATKVEVSVPGEVTVNKTVQVTVKLTDANGNPIDGQVTVSSALGSETVNITKGTGVYQYTPKAIGEDTISVKFAGNDTFYLSSNSSNVKVVAEQQKTPVKPAAKTVVSLSFVKAPKKVSKKAKKLILYAKLKINGKLAKGKKLTFKFKGKTFKVKTNKNGVAKLTIKSKVLKKLLKKVKAGKKVKYQVSYGKKTVKKTLKVKK